MAAAARGVVDRGGFLPKQASERSLLSVEDGIGVVAIEGPILRKPDLFARIFFGATGSEDIGAALREAAGRDDIKAVFLNIDSPGGTVAGTPELADAGYYTNMLADDVVAKSFNLNLNAPAVTEGMVKRIAGFNLHETTLIPSDHAEKLVGFAAHSSAVAVAMRYLQPVADYQQAGAVTDPATGMTFGYLRFTDTRANKVFVTLECLYGFAPAKNDALKRIVKP